MKRHFFTTFALIFTVCFSVNAQLPLNTLVQITKAEDARRYDSVLEGLLKSPNAAVRERAALAVGRIGDKRAIPLLTSLFEDRKNEGRVWTAAVFALGEIESADGGEAVLNVLKAESGYSKRDKDLLSRAVEAAGKIVAANAKDTKLDELKSAIIRVLNEEIGSGARMREVVLSGLTAILRARPDGGDEVVAKFLTDTDPRIRTDAANTLTRLRAKNANETLRKMLASESDGAARANAARALGAAEDKDAVELLLKAATTDADMRVRVSAIRAVGGLKDAKAAEKLIERAEALFKEMKSDPATVKKPTPRAKPIRNPSQKNELIEIATVLGRLLTGTADKRAVKFLDDFALFDNAQNAEISVARMKIEPGDFTNSTSGKMGWKEMRIAAQLAGELAAIEPKSAKIEAMKKQAPIVLRTGIEMLSLPDAGDDKKGSYAVPDFLQAYALFKTSDLDVVLRSSLGGSDVQIRAAAVGLIAERPVLKLNTQAMQNAFTKALIVDKRDNDAKLAILDALGRLDKKAAVGTFLIALDSPDYLVRKKAFELLEDNELQKDFPGIPVSLENARKNKKDQVLAYSAVFGTKLGQVLNADADYRRALSRKNGSVKAVLTTEKGAFTIVFNPEEAPLTVDNWVKLARSGYFNGLEVHRVVPNFVMQDGDPRGDGNGGPGWSIRCEVNTLPYGRGAVGMALSGKDTGGSQWFVTHSPQPHLDGGYTVFGRVNEMGMKVVDNIVRGDKILKVTIVGK